MQIFSRLRAFRARRATTSCFTLLAGRRLAPFALLTTALFCFLLFLTATSDPASASRATNASLLPDEGAIPSEYGEIVYRTNSNSPKMLYIIGISHRNAASRMNTANTVQTQMEIFRIGEWLNRKMALDLLLPEGYFNQRTDYFPQTVSSTGQAPISQPDLLLLQARLADETSFVNAEMLLMEQFNMHASQVEDRKIYNAVRSGLGKLNAGNDERLAAAGWAELHYLQQLRTAVLLQNIPAAIEDKLLTGKIRNHSALFTIGLNHLQDIIRYLEEDTIRIEAPSPAASQFDGYQAELNLVRQGYNITIIIPRTLADDRRLLQMTNLDRYLPAKGRPSMIN